MTNTVSDPAVKALIDAINAGDKDAFHAALTPDATLSDDGTERNLEDWSEREIFSSNGRLEVESSEDEGRSLIANYSNDRWGAMRTSWRFTVRDGKVSRIDAGQA